MTNGQEHVGPGTHALLRQHVRDMLVSHPFHDECTTVTLGDELLPGVTLSVNQDGGYLSAHFDCCHASRWRCLADMRFELAERLAQHLEASVQIRVTHAHQADTAREARAGCRT
ncbi:hypothetical protein [Pandoraea iniqua]|nr:hypothetical protein [Pandoraea iniqua]